MKSFKKFRLLRTWLVAALLATPFALQTSCVDDPGLINRTGADKIDKRLFEGVWLYVATTVDAPYSTALSFTGHTNFGDAAKVVFDIQESWLVAYPVVEAVEGSEKFLGRDHVTTIQIKLNYARALWGYHLYGYDGYRDDLRKAIEILEDLVQLDPIRSGLFDAREEEKGEMDQSQAIVGALVRARNEQLDWCIHDLTPATFEAYRDS